MDGDVADETRVLGDAWTCATRFSANGRLHDAIMGFLRLRNVLLEESHKLRSLGVAFASSAREGAQRHAKQQGAGAKAASVINELLAKVEEEIRSHLEFLRRNHYTALQLPPPRGALADPSGSHGTVTDVRVKKQYRQLALRFHPDKAGGTDSSSLFAIIRTAYENLATARSRALYRPLPGQIPASFVGDGGGRHGGGECGWADIWWVAEASEEKASAERSAHLADDDTAERSRYQPKGERRGQTAPRAEKGGTAELVSREGSDHGRCRSKLFCEGLGDDVGVVRRGQHLEEPTRDKEKEEETRESPNEKEQETENRRRCQGRGNEHCDGERMHQRSGASGHDAESEEQMRRDRRPQPHGAPRTLDRGGRKNHDEDVGRERKGLIRTGPDAAAPEHDDLSRANPLASASGTQRSCGREESPTTRDHRPIPPWSGPGPSEKGSGEGCTHPVADQTPPMAPASSSHLPVPPPSSPETSPETSPTAALPLSSPISVSLPREENPSQRSGRKNQAATCDRQTCSAPPSWACHDRALPASFALSAGLPPESRPPEGRGRAGGERPAEQVFLRKASRDQRVSANDDSNVGRLGGGGAGGGGGGGGCVGRLRQRVSVKGYDYHSTACPSPTHAYHLQEEVDFWVSGARREGVRREATGVHGPPLAGGSGTALRDSGPTGKCGGVPNTGGALFPRTPANKSRQQPHAMSFSTSSAQHRNNVLTQDAAAPAGAFEAPVLDVVPTMGAGSGRGWFWGALN